MAAPSSYGTSAPGQPPDQGLLTIDQLAARTGITVRTIRYYAGRGLLPPPQLRGRTGLYGDDHVARLELVAELSALGFTLTAIESHLERLPPTAGADELALQRALPTEMWQKAHRIIEQHATALAEDLMTMFQDDVLQPYRDRGRPPAERDRLAGALTQLKPITVRGVVTAFGRAVNRTIRDRLA
jgi:DNA-binding transcriptional MerR regulator